MKLIGLVIAAVLSACVPIPSANAPYQAQAYSYSTGVYINGQELTADQKAQLDTFLGDTLPAGRYTVNAQYQLGVEGQAPSIDLVAIARSREQQTGGKEPFSMYSTDSAGRGSSIVSDGGCMILSTPDGSLSSGC